MRFGFTLAATLVLGLLGSSFSVAEETPVRVAANPPKPGTAAWNRRMREHERRMKEFRKRNQASTERRAAPSQSSASRKGSDLRERVERSLAAARNRPSPEEARLARMSPTVRRIHDRARNPAPLDPDRAPRARACLLMFRDALNDGESFDILLQCLAPVNRLNYVSQQVDEAHPSHGESDEEYMQSWRRVVAHITKIDSSRSVEGVEGWVDVRAQVRAPGLSYGVYRFRMVGEGRFYRLMEYRCDVIHLK